MAQSAAHKHDSTRRATYQDVLDAPAHVVAEIIDGTLHTHPRPAPAHTVASCPLNPGKGTTRDSRKNNFRKARSGVMSDDDTGGEWRASK